MNLRNIRDRLVPWATKHRFLASLNPLLKAVSPHRAVQTRLETCLQQNGLRYLDLGGWLPVEGYLTIHLSPVEIYGFPVVPKVTMEQRFDEDSQVALLESRVLSAPGASLHYDILNGLPLADGSMEGVNLSHILEHFDIAIGRRILGECRRVLKPGGAIRISCPDLRKYAHAYIAEDKAFFSKVGGRAFCNYENLKTIGAVVAAKAYDAANGHKWFYDAATVISTLVEIGFIKVEERALHQSNLPNIAGIEPAYRSVESFYVEAVTPCEVR